MTPNLKRLFGMARGDRFTRDNVAYMKKSNLLEDHGEALVEALEEHVYILTQFEAGLISPEREALAEGRELLAQLESEAQP